MVIYFPLLIAIIGVLVYALVTNNPKIETIGLHMFWTGLLVFMMVYHGLVK